MNDDPIEPASATDAQQPVSAPSSARGPRSRRLWLSLAAGALLVVGVATTAVVLDHRADVAEAKAEAKRLAAEEAEQARLAAERERKAEEAAELAARQEEYDGCRHELSALRDALDVVDARLNVGLSQDDFSTLVGDASVEYNRVDIDALGTGACLQAGAKLETALNAYGRVASRWNDCIFDYYCDMDSIDPMMQRNWSLASRNIAKATDLIESLDPSNPENTESDQV